MRRYRNCAMSCAALGLAMVLGGCEEEDVRDIPEPTTHTDTFDQKEAAQVDILWIVDNSESMEAEQNKIADRFSQFFKQLLISQVNFHIGVVTTDPDFEAGGPGVLHAYDGPNVSGCTGDSTTPCRFITKDVPCNNPDVSFNPGTPEAQIEEGLLQQCPAQLVFRRLIRVGVSGDNFERGLENAAAAIGAQVDPVTGAYRRDADRNLLIPEENIGFLRQDASLYLIFVSDEEDSSKGPLRYYYRLFEGIKFAGNENRVAISAITGWPGDAEGVNMSSVCDILDTGFDSDAGNDDPKLETARSILAREKGGCFDPSDSSPNRFAEVGGRFVELACRTAGVVADICSDDYSTALDALGANAAGLTRKFVLSKANEIHFGVDCKPFTPDDPSIACGNLDETENASPLCVIATPLSGGGEVVVPRSDVSGWRYEAGTKSVRFDGSFIPAPGTQVRISYKIRPASIVCEN